MAYAITVGLRDCSDQNIFVAFHLVEFMPKNIVLVASMDTKTPEAEYLKDLIEAHGNIVTIIDTSSMNTSGFKGQISSDEIARAAGLQEGMSGLLKLSRPKAAEVIAKGVGKVVKKVYEDGKLDGIISVGGVMGTFVGTAAMRALPIGVPKIMVSAMAAENMKPYVGSKDIVMYNSVTDIVGGLNRINRTTLASAAAAISAMVSVDVLFDTERLLVGVTSYGVIQDQIMRIKSALEKRGYDFAAFHGAYGRASMEELVENGVVNGGIVDMIVGGFLGDLLAAGEGAEVKGFEAAGEKGLPQVIVPGGADSRSVPNPIPAEFRERKYHFHNPSVPLVRTTVDELSLLAKVMCDRVNRYEGPTAVIIPVRGFSPYSREGGPLADHEADMAFAARLKRGLRPSVRYLEVDNHISDPELVDVVMRVFFEMTETGRKKSSS